MMRAVVTGLVLLGSVLPSVASGKPSPGDFGVGIVAGEPSGLSAKVFVDDVHAFAAGLSFSFVDDTMHVQGDYLIHLRGRLKVLRAVIGSLILGSAEASVSGSGNGRMMRASAPVFRAA